MQPKRANGHFTFFIDLLCNYFQGKDGSEPTQGALNEAKSIRKAYKENPASGKDIRKSSILVNMIKVYKQVCVLALTGNPEKDWLAIMDILKNGSCKRLRELAEEVRNIRLLDRGTQLRQELSKDWRRN